MQPFLKRNQAFLVTLLVTILVIAVLTRGMEPRVWVSVLLSGVTLAAIYFLIASGLSLIFGLMDVLNFAHGGLFVLGAYAGLSTYQNPRLILNVTPFFLALAAGAFLGRSFGVLIWRRVENPEFRRALWWAFLLVSAGIATFALRQFPILRLNAFGIAAVGGAVPTAEAQEPLWLMFQRTAMLLVAGIPFGFLLAPKEPHEIGERSFRRGDVSRSILYAILLIVAAAAMLYSRDPAEHFWLGLPGDLRFVLALLFGALAGVAAGIVIEVVLIRPFYGSPVTQLVLTLGLSIVFIDLIELVWGPEGHPPMQPPSLFTQPCRAESLIMWLAEGCRSIDVLGRAFPTYRVFIIAVGVFVFTAVGMLLKFSRIGMIIRAGVQDREMVQALGIDVQRVFTFVFALGSALAAIGGVIAAPFLGVYPVVGAIFLLQAFIAVVIGGMGSYVGAAVGTLLLGLARAFGDQFVAAGIQLPFMEEVVRGSPAIARASTVLIMAVVLLVRPSGIFGKKE